MNNVRFAWRMARHSPGFALVVTATLALAIGANTAVFSLVDAVLLKPLPYPQPERLALVNRIVSRRGVVLDRSTSHTGAVWEAVRDTVRTADSAVLSGISARVSLVTGDGALAVRPQRVSAGYFRVIGVAPAHGREFVAEEDRPGGASAVVLSDRVWRTVLGADPGVLGRTILLKGEPHNVVGVMPSGFRTNVDADLWTPLRPSRTGEGEGDNYAIVVRLHDEATWAEASAEVAAAADPAIRRPAATDGVAWTHDLRPLQEGLVREAKQPLLLLWGAVGLVLMVACINLAGLLLARAGSRSTEIATRMAVGGNRRAVVRQMLVESLLLTLPGGFAGIAVGAALLEGLKISVTDAMLVGWSDVTLDGRVLALTLSLSLLTALLMGLVPGLQATRVDVRSTLAGSPTRSVAGGAGGWPRRLLVVSEVALGVVVLVAAGLLLRTFLHLQATPAGFDPRHLVAASASLEDARYAEHAQVSRLFDASLERLRALPGVESAAVSLGLPYERILNMGVQIVGADASADGGYLFSTATYVTPGYFETLRLPVPRGRTFTAFDTPDAAPVVVVNDAFASRYFRGRGAVGQRIRLANRVREIIGVAANVPQQGGFNGFGPVDALPGVYVPFSQFPSDGLRVFHAWFSPAWIVRERVPNRVSEMTLRELMAAVDPQVPLASVRPVDEVRAAALERQRTLMTLVGLLGVAALLLAAMGIHAVIASGVAERTRELGIRMALGASPAQALGTVSGPGIVLAVIGLGLGGAIAYGASGLIRGLLWGVTPNDPLTFVVVAAVLLAVTCVASLAPAIRAVRIDPASTLRH